MKIDTDKTICPQTNHHTEDVVNRKKSFQNKVLVHNIIACQPPNGSLDNKTAINECQDNFVALGAQGGLQEMLVAQITSTHLLHQRTIALANKCINIDHMSCYTNSAIKLANCFTQQATLLARLQGKGSQHIIVKHIEIQKGAQAVVGNINGGTPTFKEEM